jgi:predicted DNA-binding ribbon-helix-helix protein
MKSRVRKRTVNIGDHNTSVSLEDEFWRGLWQIAINREQPLARLVAEVKAARVHGNLSSALRIFVLEHYQAEAARHRTTASEAASAANIQAQQNNLAAASESTCTPKS